MRSKPVKRVLLAAGVLGIVLAAALPFILETEHHELDDAFRSRGAGSFVELGPGKVYYELAGPDDGPVVVLVHRFSTPSFIWDPTFERLAANGFRVLRYDHYGRGYSSVPWAPSSSWSTTPDTCLTWNIRPSWSRRSSLSCAPAADADFKPRRPPCSFLLSCSSSAPRCFTTAANFWSTMQFSWPAVSA